MKKLLIALLLGLLLFSSAHAETITPWQNYAPTLKAQESARGSYASWSDEDRVALAMDILDMGYLTPSEDTARLVNSSLPMAERAATADELLIALIGYDSILTVDVHFLTYAIMGWESFWTPAQRVWWQDLLGYNLTDAASDTYVLPTEDDLPEEEAIAIAKAAVIKAYALEADALDSAHPVADLYVTKQRPELRRWHISFRVYADGTDHYELRSYEAIVNQEGVVIEDPDIDMQHVYMLGAESLRLRAAEEARAAQEPTEDKRVYAEYAEKNNDAPFWEWPYEDKAAYSAIVKPIADQKEVLTYQIGASTYFAYGLPGQGDMLHDQAVTMAQDSISRACGVSLNDLALYTLRYEFFDVTDPGAPLWKFIFVNPDDIYGTRYRVELNARTGETVQAVAFPWREIDWYDLEYIVEWYH